MTETNNSQLIIINGRSYPAWQGINWRWGRTKTMSKVDFRYSYRLTLAELQNGLTPEESNFYYNLEDIIFITDKNGKKILLFRYDGSLFLEGCTQYPCIKSKAYNELLSLLLSWLGQEWWSPSSHEDLCHYKTVEDFEEMRKEGCSYYDELLVSPCHQLVMSTFVCNDYFSVPLPQHIIIKILGFLPQEFFRGGNVVNCSPVEREVTRDSSILWEDFIRV